MRPKQTPPASGLRARLGAGGPVFPGRIAFIVGTDIWQWSNGATNVFASGRPYGDPAWSPSGAQLAVVVYGTNQSDIALLNSGGKLIAQLTHDGSNVSINDTVWARRPAWSPNGKLIAYITDRGGHDMSLWVIGSDGGVPRPILLEKPYSGGLDWPTWSPDGTEIAYTTFVFGSSQVHAFNLKTNKARVIAKDPEGDFDPCYSPDGKYIAYAGRSGAQDNIFIVPSAGGDSTQITHGGLNRAPVWSPKSDALAYVTSTSEHGFDLYAVQLDLAKGISASVPQQLSHGLNIAAESGLSWTGGIS